jgi:hypothetical protein
MKKLILLIACLSLLIFTVGCDSFEYTVNLEDIYVWLIIVVIKVFLWILDSGLFWIFIFIPPLFIVITGCAIALKRKQNELAELERHADEDFEQDEE